MTDSKTLTTWLWEVWQVIPQDINLYLHAITLPDYERLEFLGDSLLDFVIADYLIKNFPDKSPGWLTKKRMTMVNETALAEMGHAMGIPELAIIPANTCREQITERVVADIVEALIGAIHLDQNIDACSEAILRVFQLRGTTEELELRHLDPMGLIQELLAQKGLPPPNYILINESGKPHEPMFEIEARCEVLGESIITHGIGKSKKEATKIAAQALLEILQKMNLPDSEKTTLPNGSNPMETLHTVLSKKGLPMPEYELLAQEGPCHSPVFKIKAWCIWDHRVIESSECGTSKKEAKRKAAESLLLQMGEVSAEDIVAQR